MKKKFIIMIISLVNLNLCAQEKYLKDVHETQQLSQQIVELFSKNKISQSFNQLALYWPLPESEIEQIKDKTIKYLNIVEQRFGKSIGILKVKNEAISDFAIQETYLVRYDITAIRLIFTFYRGNNGWILNGFKWDDAFTEEFR